MPDPVPSTMQAMVLQAPGKALQAVRVPVPAPGPGQIHEIQVGHERRDADGDEHPARLQRGRGDGGICGAARDCEGRA